MTASQQHTEEESPRREETASRSETVRREARVLTYRMHMDVLPQLQSPTTRTFNRTSVINRERACFKAQMRGPQFFFPMDKSFAAYGRLSVGPNGASSEDPLI
jgi:hypothetical protein